MERRTDLVDPGVALALPAATVTSLQWRQQAVLLGTIERASSAPGTQHNKALALSEAFQVLYTVHLNLPATPTISAASGQHLDPVLKTLRKKLGFPFFQQYTEFAYGTREYRQCLARFDNVQQFTFFFNFPS